MQLGNEGFGRDETSLNKILCFLRCLLFLLRQAKALIFFCIGKSLVPIRLGATEQFIGGDEPEYEAAEMRQSFERPYKRAQIRPAPEGKGP